MNRQDDDLLMRVYELSDRAEDQINDLVGRLSEAERIDYRRRVSVAISLIDPFVLARHDRDTPGRSAYWNITLSLGGVFALGLIGLFFSRGTIFETPLALLLLFPFLFSVLYRVLIVITREEVAEKFVALYVQQWKAIGLEELFLYSIANRKVVVDRVVLPKDRGVDHKNAAEKFHIELRIKRRILSDFLRGNVTWLSENSEWEKLYE